MGCNSAENRGDRIRTCDLLVPNQALYQAKLHPVDARDLTCYRPGRIRNLGARDRNCFPHGESPIVSIFGFHVRGANDPRVRVRRAEGSPAPWRVFGRWPALGSIPGAFESLGANHRQMNRTKFLLAVVAIALSGGLLRGQEPPLPAKTETPAPAGTRPQLNIPDIPVEPPTLVPDASNSTPSSSASPPAKAKAAAALSELDAVFQRSPLAAAAEEQRLHLEWRQLQNRTAHDSEVVAAREAVRKAKTDVEKRKLIRGYYTIYYAHMEALADTPEVKNYLNGQKAAALNGLAQPKVRPTPTPRPTPAP
jgi:hypothetical protein